MSLESTFPFLYNYWPHLFALIISYTVAVYFIKAKNPDSQNRGKGSASNKNQETKGSSLAGKKKKYLSPDQGWYEGKYTYVTES